MTSADGAPAITLSETQRLAIMICSVTATILSTLDMTIANVALPHMQGGLSASQDQMTWVLTSYIVASAMTMPLSGWLASTFGRRNVLLVSITGFIIASALCGLAQNLTEIVLFRTMQGIFGAALVPISQALMLDVTAPSKQGGAMALWTAGALVGPTAGPIVGGYLTDALNWRWVFYINVPIGIATVIGLWLFVPRRRRREKTALDLIGYTLLALAVGAFQLMLDRGETKGWLSSNEIQIELLVAALAFYLFLAHSATTQRPFFSPALFRDRNYAIGTLLCMLFGILMFSNVALAPSLQQQLLNYSALTSGIVSTPRGFASLTATFLAAWLMRRRVDARWMAATGFILFAIGCNILAGLSLDTDSRPIIVATIIQGFASQLAFVPLATISFATLDPRYRNEGAALSSVARNIGASSGISVMQTLLVQNTQIAHANLVEHIRPDNPMLAMLPAAMSPDDPRGAVLLNAFITRQATMVAYVDDFHLLVVLALIVVPATFLLRPGNRNIKVEIHVD